MEKSEQIGGITLNYEYYSGQDLYSDGDAIENHILEIVKNESGYEYYHKDYSNWAVLYHLSRQRENIVSPMQLDKSQEVLEVGAGMGAITGALAKKAGHVDCIELSRRRSLVNAYRHRDLDNVEIFVGNFQDIQITKKYDVITLIGVLEYAAHYINSKTPYEDFISKISECLKPNGILYIAIENKLGIKYFAGYNEDHLAKPFVGIEGYSDEDKVRTFTRSQLIQLLEQNGFQTPYFYYPFPDYKLPSVIYDEESIVSQKVDYPAQSNFDFELNECFHQVCAMQSLQGTEEIKMLANSFLIEAYKEGN